MIKSYDYEKRRFVVLKFRGKLRVLREKRSDGNNLQNAKRTKKKLIKSRTRLIEQKLFQKLVSRRLECENDEKQFVKIHGGSNRTYQGLLEGVSQ